MTNGKDKAAASNGKKIKTCFVHHFNAIFANKIIIYALRI
jgi:hypothetical protein